MKQTSIEWVLQYLNNVKPNEFCSIEKIKELLEQAKEMHKQEMAQLPQQEISDEEIEKEIVDLLYEFEYEEIPNSALYKFDYENCAKALTKWYREQLKQRQCNKQQ